MSLLDLPLNRAHQHAANAEDHWNNGLLVLAAEEHTKAADAYLAAIERSHDESAKRTLRMLYDEQRKAEKELQRKIEKLKQDGKDPHLSYKQERPVSPLVRGLQGTSNSQHAPRSASSRPMIDTVDESFMLLGGQHSDPGDAFNQFWTIMQGMLDTLSQPVAFATAPLIVDGTKSPPGAAKSSLHHQKKDFDNTSDTENEESIFAGLSRLVGMSRDSSKQSATNSNPTLSSDGFEDVDDFLEGDEMLDSFCLVPTDAGHTPAFLRRENVRLKTEVESMQRRLEAMQHVIQLRKEQELQLRDSIFQATREAQRVMGASTTTSRPRVDSGSTNANVPPIAPPNLANGREAQYLRRVKELEEEVRNLRNENEKNKTMITKYRERWEKLKESAKRKKEAKASTGGVRERIMEEPEAEEQLDFTASPSKF